MLRIAIPLILLTKLIAFDATTNISTSSPTSDGRSQTEDMEIDAGKILWQARSNETKYLGKILKVLPPRIPGEGWEYEYARGSGTVGTKKETLLLLYRYKRKPANWQEALHKVGLPTKVPPLDFGTSLIWPASGTTSQPITFHGKVLNRVILAKDFSEITIDGHEPGTL